MSQHLSSAGFEREQAFTQPFKPAPQPAQVTGPVQGDMLCQIATTQVQYCMLEPTDESRYQAANDPKAAESGECCAGRSSEQAIA